MVDRKHTFKLAVFSVESRHMFLYLNKDKSPEIYLDK